MKKIISIKCEDERVKLKGNFEKEIKAVEFLDYVSCGIVPTKPVIKVFLELENRNELIMLRTLLEKLEGKGD